MATEDSRRDRLHDSIRQIVVTRERTPRSPNWAAAWRRTLLRYVDTLNRGLPEPSPPEVPGEDEEES